MLKKRERGPIQIPEAGQSLYEPLIISGMGEAMDFIFGQYIQAIHSNKKPLKVLRKGSVGISRDCQTF